MLSELNAEQWHNGCVIALSNRRQILHWKILAFLRSLDVLHDGVGTYAIGLMIYPVCDTICILIGPVLTRIGCDMVICVIILLLSYLVHIR